MFAISLTAIRRCAKLSFSSKYLLYTNTGISVGMSVIGDGLQQYVQISNREIPGWNWRRSRDVAFSGFLIGPACHYWYIYLDKWLPGRSFKIVTKKIVVDQFICSPVVISSFLVLTSYLEGKRGTDLQNEVLQKGYTLYKAEWLVWPPAQTINFFLLPTKYRVLFDNVVSFCFDWYYSYVKYGTCLDSAKDNFSKREHTGISTNNESLVPNIRHPGSHLPPLYLHNTMLADHHRGQHIGPETVTDTSDHLEVYLHVNFESSKKKFSSE